MALGARRWGRYPPMVFLIGVGVLPGCGEDDPETGTEPRAARGAPEFTVPAWDPLALDPSVDQVAAEAMAPPLDFRGLPDARGYPQRSLRPSDLP